VHVAMPQFAQLLLTNCCPSPSTVAVKIPERRRSIVEDGRRRPDLAFGAGPLFLDGVTSAFLRFPRRGGFALLFRCHPRSLMFAQVVMAALCH
jgi:hypothetical protein